MIYWGADDKFNARLIVHALEMYELCMRHFLR